MIDRCEMLHDIGPKDIAVLPREALQPIDGLMGALGLAVGVAVRDKDALKARLYDVAHVVHDPIAKTNGANFTPLRVLDVEMNVRARTGPLFPRFLAWRFLDRRGGLEHRHRGEDAPKTQPG
jgi:hypothetical protein